MKRLAVAGLLALWGGAMAADSAVERIRAQRAEAAAVLAAKERECAGRFVVAACLDAARSERRATLARLRSEEIALDDAHRTAAAAAAETRRKDTGEKAASPTAREAASAPEVPRVQLRRSRPAQAVEASPIEPVEPPGAGPAVRPKRPAAKVDEARNRARFETRRRAAEAKREVAEVREQKRRKEGKTAAPLPLPPGAN